jgi:hypothetical protein
MSKFGSFLSGIGSSPAPKMAGGASSTPGYNDDNSSVVSDLSYMSSAEGHWMRRLSSTFGCVSLLVLMLRSTSVTLNYIPVVMKHMQQRRKYRRHDAVAVRRSGACDLLFTSFTFAHYCDISTLTNPYILLLIRSLI